MVRGDGGAAARVKTVVVGTTRPTCKADFRSRFGLLRHMVHGASTCVAAAALLPALPEEELYLANEQDRRDRASRRRRGIWESAGLPFVRPVLHLA